MTFHSLFCSFCFVLFSSSPAFHGILLFCIVYKFIICAFMVIFVHLQWNLYNADTIGSIPSVLNKEVSLLRRFTIKGHAK